MPEINGNFGDREIMMDVLTSQKEITTLYNISANEGASNALKSEFMSILSDEHQIQMDIFNEMSKRGWYQTEQAPQQKIDQAKEQFSNTNS